ncbi:creatininase family protein [Sphingomonas sp. MMS24-J13]|uniref:creatininase family protein n=1 Tax=Sphingomonas sp. MMS24-J13 TaxID=3238686 RepID=UPI00384D869F
MMHQWRDLAWPDFTTIDFDKAVALMPVAAIEQHGPHLPVSVDSDINAGVVAAAAEFLPSGVEVYVLPQLPIGKSNEHSAFPGTLSIGAETLMKMWTDVGESVVRAGFRKLVILNSHGGQPQIVEIVARELRVRHGVMAVSAATYALRAGDDFGAHEARHGIHGGAVETSMMMHLRPGIVREQELRNYPALSETIDTDYSLLRLEGGIGIGWMTQDVNPMGAIGDASRADREIGADIVRGSGQGLATLLAEVSRYPLGNIRDRA